MAPQPPIAAGLEERKVFQPCLHWRKCLHTLLKGPFINDGTLTTISPSPVRLGECPASAIAGQVDAHEFPEAGLLVGVAAHSVVLRSVGGAQSPLQ